MLVASQTQFRNSLWSPTETRCMVGGTRICSVWRHSDKLALMNMKDTLEARTTHVPFGPINMSHNQYAGRCKAMVPAINRCGRPLNSIDRCRPSARCSQRRGKFLVDSPWRAINVALRFRSCQTSGTFNLQNVLDTT